MPDGSQGPEIRRPLFVFGAGASLAFVLSACGTPPEAVVTFAQDKIDAATSQPHVEEMAMAQIDVEAHVEDLYTVKEGEVLLSIVKGGDASVWIDKYGNPVAWFKNWTALNTAAGIDGALPSLDVGDKVKSDSESAVEAYVEQNKLRADGELMVVEWDQVVNEDGSIYDTVKFEGGDYGTGVTFRWARDGSPGDNVWEVEVDDQWMSATAITSIMRANGVSFYEAKQQYQASQSASN